HAPRNAEVVLTAALLRAAVASARTDIGRLAAVVRDAACQRDRRKLADLARFRAAVFLAAATEPVARGHPATAEALGIWGSEETILAAVGIRLAELAERRAARRLLADREAARRAAR